MAAGHLLPVGGIVGDEADRVAVGLGARKLELPGDAQHRHSDLPVESLFTIAAVRGEPMREPPIKARLRTGGRLAITLAARSVARSYAIVRPPFAITVCMDAASSRCLVETCAIAGDRGTLAVNRLGHRTREPNRQPRRHAGCGRAIRGATPDCESTPFRRKRVVADLEPRRAWMICVRSAARRTCPMSDSRAHGIRPSSRDSGSATPLASQGQRRGRTRRASTGMPAFSACEPLPEHPAVVPALVAAIAAVVP